MRTARPVRRNKYGARRVQAHGYTFDSVGEAARWGELRLLERAGHIRNLRRQIPYPIDVNGVKICKYVADFTYDELHKTKWLEVVEDKKGFKTPAYKLKNKLIEAVYGIKIRET